MEAAGWWSRKLVTVWESVLVHMYSSPEIMSCLIERKPNDNSWALIYLLKDLMYT